MRRALLLFAMLPLGACDDIMSGCENTVVTRLVSPDGEHAAVLFERNCGATTGFSTQISIVAANAKPSGKGNAYIADGGAPAAEWGGPWAKMRWTGPDQLEISTDPKSRVFVRESEVGGVSIHWREAPPPPRRDADQSSTS